MVLATPSVTGEYLAKAVWDRIVSAIPAGTLQLVKLVQTRDLFYEYAG
jgi:6-pyruvoyltetrahydropterin/6-carboxytetrahydropterin synthase